MRLDDGGRWGRYKCPTSQARVVGYSTHKLLFASHLETHTSRTRQLEMSDKAMNSTANTDGTFAVGDFSIDEYRPIRVAVMIGAGISGVVAGVRYVRLEERKSR